MGRHIDDFKNFENEELNEVETINIARVGDYIVKNPTGEEYVLTPEKFYKNYHPNPISDEDSKLLRHKCHPSQHGFKVFVNRAEERNVVEVTIEIMERIKDSFKQVPSQEEFFKFIKNFETKKAEKSVKVKARIAQEEEKIITLTKSTPDSSIAFKFKASWGEDMILRAGDFLVVSESEVYRIGKKEFESTYKFI
jgi:hypothetical protein